MKYPRIVDRVPLPIRPGYETWRAWCLKVSDELVDMFPEYQKAALESEALFSAAATAIYKIPSGCFGDIGEITFFDVLLHSLDILGPVTYLTLAKRSGAVFRYLPALVPKWNAGLVSARITGIEWARAVGIEGREVKYWAECGLHLR
ncbi:MAG: hypothetical protein Q7U75_00775, partial [Desulfobacterales bacterium]|nr:hypothetical protein [Desulfobacterales bacterium]